MVMTDQVADMLTRIRNAKQIKSDIVEIPHSKLKEQIAKLLLEEGYIISYDINDKKVNKKISIKLKYIQNKCAITGIKKISKPGLRIYSKANELPKVLSGLGVAIISTSKGIYSDKEARKQNLGGEVLAYVW